MATTTPQLPIEETEWEQIEREACRRHFNWFVHRSWAIVEPHTAIIPNWHIDYISEYCMAVHDGELKRVLFNIPPRHMKSRLITTMFPVWEWIDSPWLRYLFSSYNTDLSRDHSRERRMIIESDWYQSMWGDRYQLVGDQNVVTNYANDKGGKMISRGTDTGATGKGGNRILVDDPHNTKEAESVVQRQKAIEDFEKNLSTRLDNPKTDAIVVIMQRLHDGDLSGHILEEIGGYEHVCIPAIEEQERIYSFPKSGRIMVRKEGELLWPERQGQTELDELRRIMRRSFDAQYQQRPTPAGGNRINIDWFPRFTDLHRNQMVEVVQSWDTANKKGDLNADTVCLTFGMDNTNQWHLLDAMVKQLVYPELKRKAIDMYDQWQPHTVLIEDKASGTSLIQDLRFDAKYMPVVAIQPESDKITRMEVHIGALEAGQIGLPEWAHWLGAFETVIARFPDCDKMDTIDAFSQFLKWKFGRGNQIEMRKILGV